MAKKVMQWVAPLLLTASLSCGAEPAQQDDMSVAQFVDVFKRGALLNDMYLTLIIKNKAALSDWAMAEACGQHDVAIFLRQSFADKKEEIEAFYREFNSTYPRDELPTCYENNCDLDQLFQYRLGELIAKVYVIGYMNRAKEDLEKTDSHECDQFNKLAEDLLGLE